MSQALLASLEQHFDHARGRCPGDTPGDARRAAEALSLPGAVRTAGSAIAHMSSCTCPSGFPRDSGLRSQQGAVGGGLRVKRYREYNAQLTTRTAAASATSPAPSSPAAAAGVSSGPLVGPRGRGPGPCAANERGYSVAVVKERKTLVPLFISSFVPTVTKERRRRIHFLLLLITDSIGEKRWDFNLFRLAFTHYYC